jgi:hypothetical protein
LALIGTLVGVGDSISQLFIWQMVSPGADRAQMVALLTRFDNATGAALIFRIGGPALVVGTCLPTPSGEIMSPGHFEEAQNG